MDMEVRKQPGDLWCEENHDLNSDLGGAVTKMAD